MLAPTTSDDRNLLESYIADPGGASFQAIVQRYADAVYAAALRQTYSPERAEEVTQVVFAVLARKAGKLPNCTPLIAWLLTTTRYVAMNLTRAETRRKKHERKAAEMRPEIDSIHATDDRWEEVAPLLDAGMVSLRADQRNAVALRFFENCTFATIASRLGISEDAAKKRVSRGVEQLRTFFERQGVALPSATLTSALASHAVHTAPAQVVAACVTGKASASVLASEISRLMMLAKAKLLATCIVATIAVGGATVATVHVVHQKLQAQAGIAPVAPSVPMRTTIVIGKSTAPASFVEGTLLGVDGKPVVGAKVMQAQTTHVAELYPEPANYIGFPSFYSSVGSPGPARIGFMPRGTSPLPSATTDAAGKFKLPWTNLPTVLVVNDDRGYVELHLEDLKNNSTVQLKAWAKVEGTLHVNGEGKIKSKIYLTRLAAFSDQYLNAVSHFTEADISPDGHFTFEHVAPGFLWVYTQLGNSNSTINPFGPSAFVTVADGSTTHVDIADHTRTVRGKFTTPPDAQLAVGWHDPRHFAIADIIAVPTDPIPLPPKWPNAMGEPERSQYFYQWQQTPGAQKFNDSMIPPGVDVESDGSFEVFGVKPGKYHLHVQNLEVDIIAHVGDDVAVADKMIEVPDDSTAPFDVGQIEVTMQPGLWSKKTVPGFAVPSLASPTKQIQLSDFRGKFVLLCGWDTKGEVFNGQRAIDMNTLQEEFGSNQQVVLLGIDKDIDPAKAQAFVADNHLDRWLMASAPRLRALPEEYQRGLKGAIIVGPDGKLLAKHLYGDRIASVLRRLLAQHNGN